MIIPVRCFTCNKTISHLWNQYETLIESGNEPKKVLDLLQINRYCCRRMFLSNVNILDKLMMYNEYQENLGKIEK